MKNIIYILTFLIATSQITVASIVAMEKITNLADGSGYVKNRISFNASSKYPIKQVTETFTVSSSGINTNLTKKSEFVGDHIIVKLKDGASVKQLENLNRKYNTFIRYKLLVKDTFLVGINQVEIDSVNNLIAAYSIESNIIEYAEADYTIKLQDTTPNDPYYISDHWGKKKINCAAAWDLETGNGNVVIAVIDTGVDYNHPDLASNMWVNQGESGIDSNGVNMATNGVDDDANGFVDDLHGWDFYNDDNDPLDGHNHGTRCAGHAGAVGNNGIGVVGVCWNIKIMALKLFSDAGESSANYMSDAVNCFAYVGMMRECGINVRITSNSWIAENFSQILYDEVKNNRDLGILCVVAAGNTVGNIDVSPVYPACFDLDNVITVTGTKQDDNLYRPEVGVGAINVDLAAPAYNVTSLNKNGRYGTGSGTSYATPMVAGAAALTWEKAPHLTHQAVFKAIMDGVDPATSMQGKSVSGGRLNVYNALQHIPLNKVIIYIK